MSKQKSLLPGDLVNKYLVNKNQVTLPKELSVSGWEMVGQDYDGASLRLILVIVALVMMIVVMMSMAMNEEPDEPGDDYFSDVLWF